MQAVWPKGITMRRYFLCFVSIGFLSLLVGCISLITKDSVPGNTPGVVEFSVMTKPAGGKYAPRNVLAIWVADNEGNFVKTLDVQANKRK